MKISDVIYLCAVKLNREYINGVSSGTSSYNDGTEVKSVLGKLVLCVANELSSMGYYVVKEEEIDGILGYIDYSSLSLPLTKVLSVKDEQGKECDWKCLIDRVEVDHSAKKLVYAYELSSKSDVEEIEFANKSITQNLIATGVCAEYLLTLSDFEGAIHWRSKFDSMLKDIKFPKNVICKERSFE